MKARAYLISSSYVKEIAKLNFSIQYNYEACLELGVFRNKGALFHNYVPLKLPYREFEELLGYFKPSI